MQVKRPVTVIAIVTEQFKQQLIKEIEESIGQVDAGVQALDSQARRYLLQLQTADLSQASAFRRQVDAEKAKQEGMKTELQARLKEAEALTLDSEFPRGTLESYVEIQTGDNLIEKIGRAEIIVKDDVVIEVRG
ncbi:MAG TPA: YlqD family protein [Armatimonadota bacterium]